MDKPERSLCVLKETQPAKTEADRLGGTKRKCRPTNPTRLGAGQRVTGLHDGGGAISPRMARSPELQPDDNGHRETQEEQAAACRWGLSLYSTRQTHESSLTVSSRPRAGALVQARA